MSDKNSRTLTLLTALTFLYDSSVLLFWPQLFFQRFTNQFRILEIIAGGFLFLLSSIFLLREWLADNWFSKYGLNLIGGVFLLCLASFHWLNQNYVTSLLLFGLAFASFISSFIWKSGKRNFISTSLFGIAYLLTGLAAIWIILLQYQIPRNLIIPYLAQFVLFVISLILNFSLIFIEPGSTTRKVFQILIAIPWLIFTLLLSLNFATLPAAIIAAFIGMSQILFDSIEFANLKNSKLARTAFAILSMVLTLQLILLLGESLTVGSTKVGTLFSMSSVAYFQSPVLLFANLIFSVLPLQIISFFIARFTSQFEIIQRLASGKNIKASQSQWNKNAIIEGGPINEVVENYSILAKKTESISRMRQVLVEGSQEQQEENNYSSEISGLAELSQQLETTLEIPVAAQLLASSLQKMFRCGFCCVLTHSPEERRLIPIAAAGADAKTIPSRYRMRTSEGLVSRAIRARKAILFNADTSDVSPLMSIELTNFNSLIIVPLENGGFLEGVIFIADKKSQFFNSRHLELADTAGSQLIAAWGRYNLYRSMVELMQVSSSLTGISELQTLLTKIAEVGKQILKNRFCTIVVSLQEKVQLGYTGNAPELLSSIQRYRGAFFGELTQSSESFVIRDTRKDPRTRRIRIDSPDLSNALISPIRLRGITIGAIFAFGKRRGVTFSEQDCFIANLLALQASALIEGCMLDQELRANLVSTRLLHGLSVRISQAGDLESANKAIAETALGLSQAPTCGLVLFSLDGNIEAQTYLSIKRNYQEHPLAIIHQAMETRKMVSRPASGETRQVCFPIQTNRRCYGGLWLEVENDFIQNEQLVEELRNLINQASVALERSILLKESTQQSDQISEAYYQLQLTYDHTLMALVSAIEMRDRETEGHCIRVAQLAIAIGKELGLGQAELKALERGSLLHDIGKIGISDAILHKSSSLTVEEWKIMRQHPKIGAKIIQNIPFLRDAVGVVLNHQERWDGSGYPRGIRGEAIPVLARIFSVADVFDALISERPYHQKISPQDAHEYLKFQANILFDPEAVKIFSQLFEKPSFLRNLGFHEI